MIEDEIIKLEKQIDQLEKNYELSKQRREKLVSEIEELDSRTEELTKQLDLVSPTNTSKENGNRKKENKELLNKCLDRFTSRFSMINLIAIVFNSIFLKFTHLPLQMVIILGISIVPEVKRYINNREKTTKFYNIGKNSITKLEEEYNSVVKLRIEKGQQYKQVRETETSTYNVYKVLKELLNEKILEPTCEDNQNQLFMNDIYYKISIRLMNHLNAFDDIETAKILFDNELKNYLIEKITDNYSSMLKSEMLEKLTTEELIQVLANYIPTSNHHTTLNHVIHAILAFAGNMQSYTIVWSEEKDETLIHNPSIIFDEQGRWNELKTHKNTDYVTIFNVVYSNLFNNFMIEEKVKYRKKKNNY